MVTALRIVFVGQAGAESPLLAELRAGGYEPSCICVQSAEGLRAALARDKYDLVIADNSMAGMPWSEPLSIAREHDTALPLIFVSGLHSGDVAAESIEIPADKRAAQCDLHSLPAAVKMELNRTAARRAYQCDRYEPNGNEVSYREIFEQAAAGIMQTTVDGHIVLVNQSMCDFLGYTRDELLGMTFQQLTHPDDLGCNLDLHAKLTRGELGAYSHEKRYLRKNGTEVWCRLKVACMHDADGVTRHVVAVVEDITERKLALAALQMSEQRVDHLGHHDPVTDLPNKELFRDRLQQSLALASRNGWITAVACIELGRFNLVKDVLGYADTDRLLQEIAHRLRDCVRAVDTVSRLGEQEFALILCSLSAADDASVVAQKVQDAIGVPVILDGKELQVTASIGIALYPADSEESVQLLRNARNAMRSARNAGGGIRFNSAEMNVQAARRLDLENNLRLALERNEFVLYYQPKVDLISGDVKGVEALLRWRQGDSIISPVEFVPLLEESGLIVPVGEWVLQQACAQLLAWRNAGLPAVTMAVNVSACQLYQKSLPEIIQSILKSAGVDPALLELELTESSLISGADDAVRLLRKIRATGVRLSIDDFGTGYSSLSYLKRFPVDTVKIDRSFITNVVSDPDDASITRAVIALTHSLDLKVVAEGVETEAQLEYLAAIHCDEIQGYYFSQPLPADECTALLATSQRLKRGSRSGTTGERTLLLVDDEENILTSLKRLLRREGYRILTASTAAAGLELLAINDVSVIVSDQRMPEMTGVEFLSRVKEIHPNTVRLVLSGFADLQSITDAINRGAIYRFLSKPWDDDELRANIRAAFRHAELIRENDELDRKLNLANEQLSSANEDLRKLLDEKLQTVAHDEILLNIAQESMQYIPLPVLGIDDNGLVAFANSRAESVLGNGLPLLGSYVDEALPHALTGYLAATAIGQPGRVDVGGQCFEVVCHLLGRASRSRGRLVVMVPRETLQ
jgi:PAS domain S-box-containing protein/diguanylate cyclase (GGDEF)-like protein